jgi:predicted PurR-regulated permease PerM
LSSSDTSGSGAVQQSAGDLSSRNLGHIKAAAIGILIIAGVAALYFARDFLLPVVFAFFIAITLRPFVRNLSRRGIPAWATTAGIVVLGIVLTLAAVLAFSGAILDWIANASEIQRTFLQRISELKSSFESLVHLTETIQEATDATSEPGVQEVVVKEPIFSTLLTFVAAYPLNIFIVMSGALVIAVFLMASGDLFYEKLIRVLPTLSDKKHALRIALDVEREVSAYLIALTAINALLAVAVGIGFWFIGMPTPHLWALLAFILNFIPYLGPIAGMLLSAAIAIVTFSDISQAMLAPAIYMLLIGLETQIITPQVLSRRMQINAVMILLALAFWAWLWGIAGIVVAVPLLVTFRVLCSHLDSLSAIGEFLSYRHTDDIQAENTDPPAP